MDKNEDQQQLMPSNEAYQYCSDCLYDAPTPPIPRSSNGRPRTKTNTTPPIPKLPRPPQPLFSPKSPITNDIKTE